MSVYLKESQELGEGIELVLVEERRVLAVGGGRADGPVRFGERVVDVGDHRDAAACAQINQ